MLAQSLGIGSSPLIVQPAQCSRATAGYRGPLIRSLSWNATPMSSPLMLKDRVPLFMFRQMPRIPVFLNLFPNCDPVALEPCRSWASPQKANPNLWSQKAVLKSKMLFPETPIFNSFSVRPSAWISQQWHPDTNPSPHTTDLNTQASSFRNTEVLSAAKVTFIPHCLLFHLRFSFESPPETLLSIADLGAYLSSRLYIILVLPWELSKFCSSSHFSEQTGAPHLMLLSSQPSHSLLKTHYFIPHFASCLGRSPSLTTLGHLEHVISRSLQILMRAFADMGAMPLPGHRLGQELYKRTCYAFFFIQSSMQLLQKRLPQVRHSLGLLTTSKQMRQSKISPCKLGKRSLGYPDSFILLTPSLILISIYKYAGWTLKYRQAIRNIQKIPTHPNKTYLLLFIQPFSCWHISWQFVKYQRKQNHQQLRTSCDNRLWRDRDIGRRRSWFFGVEEAAEGCGDLLAVGPGLDEVGLDGGVHDDVVDDHDEEGGEEQAVLAGHAAGVAFINYWLNLIRRIPITLLTEFYITGHPRSIRIPYI